MPSPSSTALHVGSRFELRADAARREFAERLVACAGAAGMFSAMAWMGPAAAAAPDARSLQGWMAKVRQAGASYSYQGTFVVTADGMSNSSRVVHIAGQRESYERVESLDGPPRSQYRHNDAVHTVWPRARIVLVEPRSATPGFPSLPAEGSRPLDELYRLEQTSESRVAGRDAWLLGILPKDALRHGHRLWVDRQTHLLLRADTLGSRGEVLESSAFSTVNMGVKLPSAVVLEGMNPSGPSWRIVRAAVHPSDLSREGWQWDANLAALHGYKLVSCVRRPINPVAEDANLNPPAIQAVFSDGLATVSVFVEDFQAQRHVREMSHQTGATHTLARRSGSNWLTVVGDVPALVAEGFVKAIKRKSA